MESVGCIPNLSGDVKRGQICEAEAKDNFSSP